MRRKNIQKGKTFEERWNFKSKSGSDFWIQLIYQGFGTPMFHWCSWCKSGGKISHWYLNLKCLFCNIESPELVNSWKPRSVLATLDEEVPFDATSVGPWLCMVLSGRADLISSTAMSWVKWLRCVSQSFLWSLHKNTSKMVGFLFSHIFFHQGPRA